MYEASNNAQMNVVPVHRLSPTNATVGSHFEFVEHSASASPLTGVMACAFLATVLPCY